MNKPIFFIWLGICFVASTAVIESLLVCYAPNMLLVWAYGFPYFEFPTFHAMFTTLIGFALIVLSTVWLTVKKL